MLQVRNMFSITCWICSNSALDMEFSKVVSFSFIPYSALSRVLFNPWLIHSDTWSYVISIGIGYLYIHLVTNNLALDISILSLYWVISNHLVTGSMIVTAFRCKFSFCPLPLMTQIRIRYTISLFHGIYSAKLAGN